MKDFQDDQDVSLSGDQGRDWIKRGSQVQMEGRLDKAKIGEFQYEEEARLDGIGSNQMQRLARVSEWTGNQTGQEKLKSKEMIG